MKKIISVILVLVLLISAVPCVAAENTQKNIVGDPNFDKCVDINDALYIQKGLVNLIELSPTEKLRGDVDNNNSLDILDASVIQKYIAKLIDKFKRTTVEDLITIIYTNDVHSFINNKLKNANSTNSHALTFASIKARKDELTSKGENVILADTGDNIQGEIYGSFDQGKSIVEIMNACKYDVGTFGNHEFDYGRDKFFETVSNYNFPILSCNFYKVEDKSLVLPPSSIIECAGKKIGFVGISTPETLTKASPKYFEDDFGNLIYNFYSGEDGQKLYDSVQKAVDEIKPKVDYVIALGHIGIDPASIPYTSVEIINNTNGIDAFIDGHSHNIVEDVTIKNKDGNVIPLTQTGYNFSNFGEMTISSSDITTKLKSEYNEIDEEVMKKEQTLFDEIDEIFGKKIGTLESSLYINNPEDKQERWVRRMETNAGDFIADSYYWYINENEDIDCDVVLQNGGGVRCDTEKGDISYKSIQNIIPFLNPICLVEVSGETLLYTLEHGARFVGIKVEDIYAENGNFFQVAGLTYDIDANTLSTEQVDINGNWLGPPTEKYKVSNVKIYNRKTKEYENLDLNKKYKVAGNNYILRNGGDGNTQLADAKLIKDSINIDYVITGQYCKSFAKDETGYPLINSINSPLSSYENYLINYENPKGSNRVNILE